MSILDSVGFQVLEHKIFSYDWQVFQDLSRNFCHMQQMDFLLFFVSIKCILPLTHLVYKILLVDVIVVVIGVNFVETGYI